MKTLLAAALAIASWYSTMPAVASARSSSANTRETSPAGGHQPSAAAMKALINPDTTYAPMTWDLMMPPFASVNSTSIMNVDAPLRNWSIIASYATKPACEAGKTITPSIPAKCVASNDPRLKASSH